MGEYEGAAWLDASGGNTCAALEIPFGLSHRSLNRSFQTDAYWQHKDRVWTVPPAGPRAHLSHLSVPVAINIQHFRHHEIELSHLGTDVGQEQTLLATYDLLKSPCCTTLHTVQYLRILPKEGTQATQ